MKNTILSAFLLFFASQCLAQVGVMGGRKTFHAPGLNEGFQQMQNVSPYPATGWQLGLDYWFRLKKRRIEFTPELSVSKYKTSILDGDLEHRQVGLHFNTAFYLLDFASDCNCPTFSKDGNFISKGFFLEVSPGVVFMNDSERPSGLEPFNKYGNSWSAGGSVGAGLDFGFSDIFTLTPLVRYHFYPKIYSLEPLELASEPESNLQQLFLGLRLRIHFKEIAKARYR